jgi:hypothetical protein
VSNQNTAFLFADEEPILRFNKFYYKGDVFIKPKEIEIDIIRGSDCFNSPDNLLLINDFY